jgi:hypothetical protein
VGIAILLGSLLLLAYGLLALFVAYVWGPGSSDELITGGPVTVPWFGLPAVGAIAAMVGLFLIARQRAAVLAVLLAAVCLVVWTLLFVLGTTIDW